MKNTREEYQPQDDNCFVQRTDDDFFNMSVSSSISTEIARRDKNRTFLSKILKRLEGYICSFENNNEVLVRFIENGQELEMLVPFSLLKRNKIMAKNQPFEFIESEVFDPNTELWGTMITYKPLCAVEDFTEKTLSLSRETQEKLLYLRDRYAED